jgi:hypothetical protein
MDWGVENQTFKGVVFIKHMGIVKKLGDTILFLSTIVKIASKALLTMS